MRSSLACLSEVASSVPKAILLTRMLRGFCLLGRGLHCLLQRAMRKLLSRIDHQEYTAQLEQLLVKSGVVNGEEGLQDLRATWYAPISCPASLWTVLI
jgi:hypothetical protein